MGDKYDIPEFRQEGFVQLSKAFPKTIEEWDNVRSGKAACMKYGSFEDISSMAKVASRLNMPDIYAAILYRCCCRCTRLIDIMTKRLPDFMGIEDESLYHCLKGREALPSLWLEFYRPLILGEKGHRMCRDTRPCTGAREVMKLDSLNRISLFLKVPSMGDLLDANTWKDALALATAEGMCEVCVNGHRTRWTKLRQQVRDNLQKMFGYTLTFVYFSAPVNNPVSYRLV